MPDVWLPCPRCGAVIETPWYRCGPSFVGLRPVTLACGRCRATLTFPPPMRLTGVLFGLAAAGAVYYGWQRLFPPATDLVLLLQLSVVTAVAMAAFHLVAAAVTSRSRRLESFET